MSRKPDSPPPEPPTLVQEMDLLTRGIENFLEKSGVFENDRILDLFRQINALQLRRATESSIQSGVGTSFALHETDRQFMQVRQRLIEYLRRRIPRGPVMFSQIIQGEKLGKNEEVILSNYRKAVDSYQGDETKFAYAN